MSKPHSYGDLSNAKNSLFATSASKAKEGGGGGSSAPTTSTSSGGSAAKTSSWSAGSTTAYNYSAPAATGPPKTFLSKEKVAEKEKEAAELRDKAKKCMASGFFSKADPVSAYGYYKKAGECYKSIGDNEKEALTRMMAGDSQMMTTDSQTSAAIEYKRAAECFTALGRPKEAADAYKKGSNAWAIMGDVGRCGEFIMLQAKELAKAGDGKAAGLAFEEMARIFVPDKYNEYRAFMQFGNKEQIAKDAASGPQSVCTGAFCGENMTEGLKFFLNVPNFSSALYICGAITAFNLNDVDSTITLAKSFLTETIVALALGDVVLAEKMFMQTHLQNTFYLNSQQCRVGEELFTAVKNMDPDALDKAKGDRANNLLEREVINLLSKLKTSGRVGGEKKEKKATAAPAPPAADDAEHMAATVARVGAAPTKPVEGAGVALASIESETADIDVGLDHLDLDEEFQNDMAELEKNLGGEGGGDDDVAIGEDEEEEEEEEDDDEIDLR